MRRLALPVALAAAVCGIAPAQILAHPGWTRSNFAAEPWYQRAVFYQIPSGAPDYKALNDRLDAMQATGIDAVIVTPPALLSLSAASAQEAIAAQAALDSFDNFTRQATARGIRVLVALPAAHAGSDLSPRARFWLTRGVAGLRLEIPADTSPQDRDAIAASVRSVAATIAGQRIVLVDDDSATAAAAGAHNAPDSRRLSRSNTHNVTAAPVLRVVTLSGPLTAATLRPQLARALASSNALLDTRPRDSLSDLPELAPVLATLALATGSAALNDPVQPLLLPASAPPPEPALEDADAAKPASRPIPPQPPPGVYLPYVPYVPPARPRTNAAPPPPAPADPLTAWTAKLGALHHSNAALRTGAKFALDFDAQNVLVWVARPASPTPQNPPVVVLCNLSAQPVQLSLGDAMKKLNLHGFFLRKLLRSDSRLGAEDIDAVKLAPYSVFIGELRR